MQEVLHAFGVDWRLIVIQIVNFALLMGALWYFLYTPVLKMLDSRREKIEQGIKDADEAAKAKSVAAEEKTTIISGAHVEAETIVANAKSAGKDKESEIISSAEEKAAQVLASAKAKSDELSRKIVTDAEAEVAKMAILATEKIINEKA